MFWRPPWADGRQNIYLTIISLCGKGVVSMFSEVKVYNYGNQKYKICNINVKYKHLCNNLVTFRWDYEEDNNKKFRNNVIRAKNKIFDYAFCNDFKYFITITQNDSYDRYDLKSFVKRVQQIIRNCRKVYNSSFSFLLIPEKHKDGAWHLHGLLSEDFSQDFIVNDNLYLEWSSYSKFGFTSIQKIKNYEACCKYITKYVTKDLMEREKASHLYYVSNDLKLPELVEDFVIVDSRLNNDYYDFINEFCKIKMLDRDGYIDFIENIKNKIMYSDLGG